MPIIFGKKSSLCGACGVCGRIAGPYGVTNLKYPKMHEIMWVCDDCVSKDKWERVYSMSGVKLTQVEKQCIGIACVESRKEIICCVLTALAETGIFDLGKLKDSSQKINEIETYILRGGLMLGPAEKLLTEYQRQLKKINN
jgi:hypothetical protein